MSGVIDRNQTGASPDVPGPTDPARPARPGASAPGSPRHGGPAPGMPAPGGPAASGTSGRAAPERPPVVRPNTAPVVVKVPPPFSVRPSHFNTWEALSHAGCVWRSAIPTSWAWQCSALTP